MCNVYRTYSFIIIFPVIIRLLHVVGTEDDVYLVFEYKTISLHKLLYNPLMMSFINLQKVSDVLGTTVSMYFKLQR